MEPNVQTPADYMAAIDEARDVILAAIPAHQWIMTSDYDFDQVIIEARIKLKPRWAATLRYAQKVTALREARAMWQRIELSGKAKQ